MKPARAEQMQYREPMDAMQNVRAEQMQYREPNGRHAEGTS